MSDWAEEAQARVGSKLNSKWSIDALLGVGGMGAVFAATHRNGSRKAIKLLHGSLVQDKEVRARFLREAMIANKIDHAARVAVIDDDVSDQGELFIVMDLLEGRSFFQLRRERGGKVPLEETLQIFDVVLDLLSQAHAEGIIHRDIKPGNIFITDDGSVKVLDFGIARMREPGANNGQELTRAGAALGTPSYCSPEQARGLVQLIDGRTDLFSVGACIYTALSGKRLHEGRSDAEAMVLAATTPAPSLASVAPDAPVELIAFVDKALSFERDRRYPNALAMLAELRTVLAGWRSGHSTVATMKGPSTTIRKANVELDQPMFGSSDEEKKRIIDKLTFVWKQINVCMKEVRHVGWTHPQTIRAFKTAYGRFGELVAEYPTCVQWQVTPAGFEQLETPLWTPDRMPFDRVPYQLFADGIRRIQFKDGMNEEEFRDFIGLVMMLATTGLPPGDDSVTFLWDKRFEYVAYEAVDSLIRNDDERQQIEELYATSLKHASHDVEDGPEARALQKNISELLQGVTDVAADCSIDPLTRSALGAQCQNITEDEWWSRFADCFDRAFDEASLDDDVAAVRKPVDEWTLDHVALQNYDEILRVFDKLTEAISRDREDDESEKFVGELSRMMVGKNTIKELLILLTKEGQQQSEETPPDLAPHLVSGLGQALRRLNSGELFGLAAGCYDAMRERKLRPVLFDYMKAWVEGREEEMGQMGVTAGVALGVALVKLLGERGEAGQRALAVMLANKDLEVRIEVLTAMVDEDRIRAEVRTILDTATDSGRLDCLKLVAKRGLTAAGPVLVVRIQAPNFHTVPGDEKRVWLETVMQLNPRRAMAVATNLVKKFNIIPRSRVEETRRLACEVLAESPPDEDVIKTLRKATKRWWWNTKIVRSAALGALARLETKQLPAAAPAAEPPPKSAQTPADAKPNGAATPARKKKPKPNEERRA